MTIGAKNASALCGDEIFVSVNVCRVRSQERGQLRLVAVDADKLLPVFGGTALNGSTRLLALFPLLLRVSAFKLSCTDSRLCLVCLYAEVGI